MSANFKPHTLQAQWSFLPFFCGPPADFEVADFEVAVVANDSASDVSGKERRGEPLSTDVETSIRYFVVCVCVCLFSLGQTIYWIYRMN